MAVRPFLALLLIAGLAGLPRAASRPLEAAQGTTVNSRAATIADYLTRVNDYLALQKKLEATLPHLPKQTTPKEVDAHERALMALIKQQRASAKPGDIFTPAMTRLIKTMFVPIFSGPGSVSIRKEIIDNEYKGDATVAINERYPSAVPVSTMPPQVLAELPKLPEGLEYRFVLHSLILLDTHAQTIADYIPNSFK